MPEPTTPWYVAVGACKGCGHRHQALRVSVLGKDITPDVNPDTCIYCPNVTTGPRQVPTPYPAEDDR